MSFIDQDLDYYLPVPSRRCEVCGQTIYRKDGMELACTGPHPEANDKLIVTSEVSSRSTIRMSELNAFKIFQ